MLGLAVGTLSWGEAHAADAADAADATLSTAPAAPYLSYRAFADSVFAGAGDPLVDQRFGAELRPPTDWWEHVSQFSAAVGFTTNRLARSTVEYGPTTDYGQRTATTDGAYSRHLHHLSGLHPDSTVHYRVILERPSGERVVSDDRTLQPKRLEGAVRIPEDLQGPPYVLGLPDTEYLVTEDLTAAATAFDVTAGGITLDLGGHVVTYDEEPVAVEGSWAVFREKASFGIRAEAANRLKVVNGTLRQGAAASAGHERQGIGFNPMYVSQGQDLEVAGVVLDYRGAQMVGLYLHWPQGATEVHHNVFRDRGTEITYRHGMGSRALGVTGDISRMHVHHNLVARTRQMGLSGARIHDNEIHIDSYSTNSYGIPALSNHRQAHDNRVYGTGYHVVAFGWGNRNHWHDNFVHLVGQGPDFRWEEYGNQESLNGFRLTQYGSGKEELHGSVVERNLVLIEGGGCSEDGECTQARGLQYFSDVSVVDNLIADNVLKVVMADGVTQAAALVTQGLPETCGTEAPVVYRGNTLISNLVNVRMGDYYGAGCNHRFFDTQMVRVGDRADYHTFLFDARRPTRDQFFFDTTFVGGAGFDDVVFSHPGQEIEVGWTVNVRVLDGKAAVAGARVEMRDTRDRLVAAGRTDAEGRFGTPVVVWSESQGGRRARTPIEISVTHEGRGRSLEVSPEERVDIEVRLDESAPHAP